MRRAASIQRVRHLVKTGIQESGNRLASHPELCKFYSYELILLRSVLSVLQDRETVVSPDACLNDLTKRAFPVWTAFETILLTLQSRGFLRRHFHLLDGSIVGTTCEDIATFSATIATLRTLEQLGDSQRTCSRKSWHSPKTCISSNSMTSR